MNVRLLALLLASTAAAPSSLVSGRHVLLPEEARELSTRLDGSLDALRAGWFEPAVAIDEQERAALRAAEEKSPELQGLRAGAATGLLLALAVLLLVVILVV